MSKRGVLAMNDKGHFTMCVSPLDERGKGRCNHVIHQEPGETPEEFTDRASKRFSLKDKIDSEDNELSEIKSGNTEVYARDYSGEYGEKTIEITQYKMTDEEKQNLVQILGRKHLEMDIDGGYIELETPLWNDMDKRSFQKETKIPLKSINMILSKEMHLVDEDNDTAKLKKGQLIPAKKLDELKKKHGDIESSTGVLALNKMAEESGFEATKDIYVMPYYLRQDPPEGDSKNPINTLYNLVILKRNDPDQQQEAYEKLLDNENARKPLTVRGGFKTRSISNEFKGKGGVMRKYMSGRRIVNSGRTVVTPDINQEYGNVKVPATLIAKMYESTIKDRLVQEGKTEQESEEFVQKFMHVDQDEISQKDRRELQRVIENSGVRLIMNRQPSLHYSSVLCFKPEVSPDATTRVNPLNLPGYNMDFDGDTASLFAINDVRIARKADKEMSPRTDHGTKMPRHRDSSIIVPQKESLWGLMNILSKRS